MVLSRNTAFAVKRILPPEHRRKMRFYFDDYGCMKCGKKDVQYGSNALRKLCMQQVKLRLFVVIKRRWTVASAENLPRTFKRMADAQRLLKDLVDSMPARKFMGKAKKRRNALLDPGRPSTKASLRTTYRKS